MVSVPAAASMAIGRVVESTHPNITSDFTAHELRIAAKEYPHEVIPRRGEKIRLVFCDERVDPDVFDMPDE